MSSRRFETLGTARDLEATGIERGQAEAIALAIGRDGEQLATRDDIERLEARTASKEDVQRFEAATRDDIERLEARTASKEDVQRFEAATKDDFARLETATKDDFARLETATRGDFARLESRTASKEDVERIVERLEAQIATKADRAELYRALWIQGGGIVAILAALKFLP